MGVESTSDGSAFVVRAAILAARRGRRRTQVAEEAARRLEQGRHLTKGTAAVLGTVDFRAAWAGRQVWRREQARQTAERQHAPSELVDSERRRAGAFTTAVEGARLHAMERAAALAELRGRASAVPVRGGSQRARQMVAVARWGHQPPHGSAGIP